jgi:hypothetical protein
MLSRITLLGSALFGSLLLSAQVQINPQIGLTLGDVSGSQPDGVTSTASAGWLLGVDARIGGSLYIQPGLFFTRTATVYTFETVNTDPNNPGTTVNAEIEDGLVRTNFKLRAMLGYKLINDEGFKLRLSAGPSYDVLMSVDNTDDNIEWNKGDFSSGSFNIDAALGLDISIFTFEPGVSIGFTDVFDTDEQAFEDFDSRNLTYFLTAGVVFGNGKD